MGALVGMGFISPFNELEEVYPPEQYISLEDITPHYDGFIKACYENDEGVLKEVFHSLGADVTKKIYVRQCEHRMRSSNKVVNSLRFDFTERTDKEYLLSGMASEHAKMFNVDPYLKEELRQLGKTLDVNKANESYIKSNMEAVNG